jgi:hypothetical protein
VTNAQVTGSRGLLRDIERIEVGAHTFQELRLLDSIRSGAIPFSADQADAERILGEAGDSLTTRLGLPPDADGETISQSLIVQLNHWHRFAEAPNAPEEVRNAARVLIRTCEGLLAGLAAKAPGI